MDCPLKFNSLDISRLSYILTRLYFVLCSSQKILFTDEEKEKVENSLKIYNLKLDEIIKFITNVIHESVRLCMEPDDLQNALVTSGMVESHANVYSKLWAEYRKEILERVRSSSLAQYQMIGLDYEYHSEVASISTARLKHPISILNFRLSEPEFALKMNVTKGQENCITKNLVLQMNKNDLTKFFNEIENIQSHIDSLNT